MEHRNRIKLTVLNSIFVFMVAVTFLGCNSGKGNTSSGNSFVKTVDHVFSMIYSRDFQGAVVELQMLKAEDPNARIGQYNIPILLIECYQ